MIVVILAGVQVLITDKNRQRFPHNLLPKEPRMRHAWTGLALMSLLVGTTAYAENAETPGIDQRQANQEQRIDQGIASGQLTEREANRLNRQQDRIDKMEDRAKSDGVVTKKERAKIHAAQDRASRNIAKQKHDRQKK
jgi:TolA-binding protein